jgi:hypothetical protein
VKLRCYVNKRIEQGDLESAWGKGGESAKIMKMSKVFADFKRITTQCELRRTLEFTIDRASYRVEILYCHSNPKSHWIAQAYSEKRDVWKCVPDFPWVSQRNEEAAIRAALSFLQDLHR